MLDAFLAGNGGADGASSARPSPRQPGALQAPPSGSGAAAADAGGLGPGKARGAGEPAAKGGPAVGSVGSVFHAQMRLSPEGVEKVAAFLESTGRVRGLSLAHNWIGDAGVKVRSLGPPGARPGAGGGGGVRIRAAPAADSPPPCAARASRWRPRLLPRSACARQCASTARCGRWSSWTTG
jgi:hypothetical protein